MNLTAQKSSRERMQNKPREKNFLKKKENRDESTGYCFQACHRENNDLVLLTGQFPAPERRDRGKDRRMNGRAVPGTGPGTERRLRGELGGRRAARGSRPGRARRGGLVHARGALPGAAAVGSPARPARPRPAPWCPRRPGSPCGTGRRAPGS